MGDLSHRSHKSIDLGRGSNRQSSKSLLLNTIEVNDSITNGGSIDETEEEENYESEDNRTLSEIEHEQNEKKKQERKR
jgi:hypothetical protein